MIISLNWIKDYVNLDGISVEELTKRFGLSTAEIEGVEYKGKEIDKVVQKTEVREVVYYRYRIREYVGGSVDYKWSTSKNDTKLLNAGYKLTGRTR